MCGGTRAEGRARTLVRGEASLQIGVLDLLGEEVLLIEEEKDRLVGISAVARDVEEVERLLQAVLLDVLAEHLVVLGEGTDEDDGGDVASQVPLGSLHTLPTHINHPAQVATRTA